MARGSDEWRGEARKGLFASATRGRPSRPSYWFHAFLPLEPLWIVSCPPTGTSPRTAPPQPPPRPPPPRPDPSHAVGDLNMGVGVSTWVWPPGGGGREDLLVPFSPAYSDRFTPFFWLSGRRGPLSLVRVSVCRPTSAGLRALIPTLAPSAVSGPKGRPDSGSVPWRGALSLSSTPKGTKGAPRKRHETATGPRAEEAPTPLHFPPPLVPTFTSSQSDTPRLVDPRAPRRETPHA